MSTLIHQRVAAARAGQNPTVVCQVSSGWVVLCDLQYLRGYTLLLPDPVVADITALDKAARTQYLWDMTVVGEALLEITGAYRINYAILGNTDPVLHAHIVPRYLDEPQELRLGPPWHYSQEQQRSVRFDAQRDQELMARLAQAIQHRL